jgi:hypothetical protein
MTMNRKIIPLALLLSFTLAGPLVAAEPAPVDPQTEYTKAVKAYVDAAGDQLKAIRSSVDAQVKNASDETKQRFKKTYEGLDVTDKLLVQLKSAGPMDFDRIKLEFERAREKTLKALDAAQKV